MVFEIGDINKQLYLDKLEGLAIRMYLGSLLTRVNGCPKDINQSIGNACAALAS